jgi:hypothetical protein
MMIAMMMPCLRRAASALCSLIGFNGRSARQGSLMIARPLRDGQESWWHVGAIQSSCCAVPRQQKSNLLNILGQTTYYTFVLSYRPVRGPYVTYTPIQYGT